MLLFFIYAALGVELFGKLGEWFLRPGPGQGWRRQGHPPQGSLYWGERYFCYRAPGWEASAIHTPSWRDVGPSEDDGTLSPAIWSPGQCQT
jgi:hypothetical protein